MYRVFYVFVWCLTLLPLDILYFFSDFLYLLVYHVVGYRRKVVRKNLTLSFPEKSLQEIIQIEKKFYRFLCDVMVETFKELHMSADEMRRRMHFEGIDLLYAQKEKGKSVMVMAGHYCNWEWTSVISLYLSDDFLGYPVYQKLNNVKMESLMLKLRTRYGAVGIEKDDLVRTLFNHKKEGILGVYGMVSDQSPMVQNIKYRREFLHQDTPVFLGTEQLSKKYDIPLFYVEISRVKRGYYLAQIKPVIEDVKSTAEHEITDKFFELLENTIQREPAYWMWSHNRWKHSNGPIVNEN